MLNRRRTLGSPHPLDVGHVNLRPRFVGQEGLSNRLSDFDLNQFLQLTEADIKAIGAQFRPDHRASAALMALYLRAVGRPLDATTVLPRNLLRYVGETFRTATPTIASLSSIYQRSQTLYKYQLWAKTHLGLTDLDEQSEAQLVALLKLQASEASHADSRPAARAGLGARRIRRDRSRDFADHQQSRSGGHAQELPRVGLWPAR